MDSLLIVHEYTPALLQNIKKEKKRLNQGI